MSKTKKQTAAVIDEELLEEPAGEAPPSGDTPTRIDWPESTEEREVNVILPDDERVTQALSLIDKLNRADSLAKEKSAAAKDFASRIETVEQEIAEIKEIVTSGRMRKKVQCHWVFQANGINDIGNPNHHTEMKTLVRDDTGEAVEVTQITADDRQMTMPLGEEESHEVVIGKLKELGYSVMETPPEVEDHDASFQAVNSEAGRVIPVPADNVADAAREALRIITAEIKEEAA